uniref:Uncharacterized protein n=1 Tax=Candidatus Kentrum sp. LFY TaxID=2126342 RepID=A0A450UVB1_9GAMM|nr:MAG: hypothetical protein BECKLFY1418A_GA0070994_10328 [Candidatus Kentron sp. LFY]VFJ96380.1 MAG: hypothetical protein BECKLFY1418B_GA0070995_108410 [Candidatus Kentron sp. LFY]
MVRAPGSPGSLFFRHVKPKATMSIGGERGLPSRSIRSHAILGPAEASLYPDKKNLLCVLSKISRVRERYHPSLREKSCTSVPISGKGSSPTKAINPSRSIRQRSNTTSRSVQDPMFHRAMKAVNEEHVSASRQDGEKVDLGSRPRAFRTFALPIRK